MSYSFDGTDDSIATATDAVANIDVTQFTFGARVYVTVTPVGVQVFYMVTDVGGAAGTIQRCLTIDVPGTAGFTFLFVHTTSGTIGAWGTNSDFALNTWHSIVVTMDTGSVANNPVFYVNGVSVAITEVSTPTGAFSTGFDTIRLGENEAGAQDYAGLLRDVFYYDSLLAANLAESISNLFSPLCYPSGLRQHLELFDDGKELRQNVLYTVSGAVISTNNPAVKYCNTNDPITSLWPLLVPT